MITSAAASACQPPPFATCEKDPLGEALKPGHGKAFEYSDCWVDDARLVVLTARDAADRGAEIHTRTRLTSAHRAGDHWEIATENEAGHTRTVRARMLVNAAGPWCPRCFRLIGGNESHDVRLVKGSHIVVRKLYDDPRCFFFQNADGRIFFSIPYQQDFTLIGTTDQDFDADPASVSISRPNRLFAGSGKRLFPQRHRQGRYRLDLFRRAPAL